MRFGLYFVTPGLTCKFLVTDSNFSFFFSPGNIEITFSFISYFYYVKKLNRNKKKGILS